MVHPMKPDRPTRLRAVLAALAVLALLSGGTAVAQEEPAGDDPAAEAEGDGNGAEDRPKKKRKKKQDEVECEAPAGDDQDAATDEGGNGGNRNNNNNNNGSNNNNGNGNNGNGNGNNRNNEGNGVAEGEDDEGQSCEPRCDDDQVDLAPEEDEANCVDQARLNQLLAQFEAAAAEEAEALEELSTQLDHLEELNSQLDTLRGVLGDVQVRLGAARADVGFAAIREEIAAEGLADVEAALADEEDELRRQAVQAYMGGDEVELAASAALLEIDNYVDMETAREYASVVIDDQLATVDRVDALRMAVETLTEVVADVAEATDVRAEQVAEIEKQVDDLIAQQRSLVAAAEIEAQEIAERIAAIQARKQEYAEELRVTGAGGGAIGELLRERTRLLEYEAPDNPFETLAMPLENTRLGSPFGPRIHPIFSDTRLHTGIDMSGAAGEQIFASADGIVVYAEEASGYGNVVVVDHGNTFATLYAHMTADAVWVGLEVEEGDLLGYVGSTGFSTGPHLHYEVRINGQPVDPMPYLKLSG